MTRTHKIISWIWLGIASAMVMFCWDVLKNQGRVNVDVLDMLPNGQSQSIADVRRMMVDTQLTQRIVILLGHPDAPIAQNALATLRQKIGTAGVPLTQDDPQKISEDYKALFTKFFSYRSYLLTDDDYHHLKDAPLDQLVTRTLVEIMNPFGYVNLAHDPFGFFTRYIKNNTPSSPFQLDEQGNLFTQGDGKTWYIYLATLTDSAFSLDIQENVDKNITPILAQIKQEFDITPLKTGAVFYALAGSQQAQNEISLIGSISLLGVLLLMLLIFRNIQAIVLALTVISVSITMGLALSLMIFSHIHIISLVLGCSLIGITVDYAIHYIGANYRSLTPQETFQKLVPALPLSAFTSALGFALLVFVPFPGVQQIGILSAIGLLAALITVFLWGPYLIGRRKKSLTKPAQYLQTVLLNLAKWGSSKQNRKIFSTLILTIGVLGYSLLKFDDNLKSFQNLDVELKHQEDQINVLLSFDKSTRFFTVRGKTIQEVLEAEEVLLARLTNKGITVKALAKLIPSDKRQQENQQLIAATYQASGVGNLFKKLGRSDVYSIKDFMPDSPKLTLSSNELPSGLRELIYQTETGDFVGRILITDVEDESVLAAIIESHGNDNLISYCDPAQNYSNLFMLYRQLVLTLIGVIFVILGCILRYRVGILGMTKILIPLTLALFGTVGLLGISTSFNFFHAIGLLLSLSIGIDYALFLFWHTPDSQLKDDTLLMCNALSAITTILSFGFLAFSKTTAVSSFGLSVFIGIILCFILTTIFLGLGSSQNDKD